MKRERLYIDGMSCPGCEARIQNRLASMAGVQRVTVHYASGTAELAYDENTLRREALVQCLGELGYSVRSGAAPARGMRTAGLLLSIVALYLLLEHSGLLVLLVPSQLAQTDSGYGMLFVVGLLTSVHCLAMCGGINLSQCMRGDACGGAKQAKHALRPALLYNAGRVLSYTALGGLVGALGGVLSLSVWLQGLVKLAAGGFMLVLGLNMLGVFPALRRFVPRLPPARTRQTGGERNRSGSGALVVGLLNGFMPCGPLQAMQLYALSTGSAVAGALAMLLFSLGTVPLMLGLSAFGTLLKQRFAAKALSAGVVLVCVMGISMTVQGMSLSGLLAAPAALGQGAGVNAAVVQEGVQIVRSTLRPGAYPEIAVEAGLPVRWIIDAPDGSINGCNYQILVPDYGLEVTFQPGENIVEFTPEVPGVYPYSCWMGMIRAHILVTGGEEYA